MADRQMTSAWSLIISYSGAQLKAEYANLPLKQEAMKFIICSGFVFSYHDLKTS